MILQQSFQITEMRFFVKITFPGHRVLLLLLLLLLLSQLFSFSNLQELLRCCLTFVWCSREFQVQFQTTNENFNINWNMISMEGYHVTTENRHKRFCKLKCENIVFALLFRKTTFWCIISLLWFLVSHLNYSMFPIEWQCSGIFVIFCVCYGKLSQ